MPVTAPRRTVHVQTYDKKRRTWRPGFNTVSDQALNMLADFLHMQGGGIGRVVEGKQVIAYVEVTEPPPF